MNRREFSLGASSVVGTSVLLPTSSRAFIPFFFRLFVSFLGRTAARRGVARGLSRAVGTTARSRTARVGAAGTAGWTSAAEGMVLINDIASLVQLAHPIVAVRPEVYDLAVEYDVDAIALSDLDTGFAFEISNYSEEAVDRQKLFLTLTQVSGSQEYDAHYGPYEFGNLPAGASVSMQQPTKFLDVPSGNRVLDLQIFVPNYPNIIASKRNDRILFTDSSNVQIQW